MQRQPLVTVIIPTFNREGLLPRAIQSVIHQTYPNWELIIVDDRSTDQTKELVQAYARQDNRIKYVLNDRSQGVSGARNCGILRSEGEYIAFLDSDDEWFAHHLHDSVEVLETENVKATFALWIENRSGGQVKFDEQEDVKEKLEKAIAQLKPRIKGNLIFFGEGFYEFTLLENFYMYHINTMVLKKEILDHVGFMEERLFANEDNDFTYRVFHDYEICIIQDYHFHYHEGTDNLYFFMDRSKADIEEIAEQTELIDKLTFNGDLENLMRKLRKGYVKKSTKLKNKSLCLKVIDESIADKYFTLGYINRKKHKLRALKFYMQALRYKSSKVTLYHLGQLLFPIGFRSNVKPEYFDIG